MIPRLDLPGKGPSPGWPEAAGTLVLGDNLPALTALLPEYEERVDLIYVDPPFLSGNAYAARVGRNEDSRKPTEWKTSPGYADEWPDTGAYLNMLYPRLRLMHSLLTPNGTLYLHLDWHASAYARLLLDEIFGPDRLLNEIVWLYHGPSPIRSAFNRKHDTILVYTKSDSYTFNADAVRVPYSPSTLKTFASSPKAGFGKEPDLERGKVPEDWWYFPVVARLHTERTGYPTQKPEALLERIVLASSNPGDLVADFFCGSGTTPIVAGRLGRGWLACDREPLAIQTTYRRLLLQESRPPVQVLTDHSEAWLPQLAIESEIRQDGHRIVVQLVGCADGARFPDNLASWEVDWDYDGKVFRSLGQAARPWREDAIPLELAHTYTSAGEYTLAVRATDDHAGFGLHLTDLTIA